MAFDSAPSRVAPDLSEEDAATYAKWFACLAEPTRVRLLHLVAGATEPATIGALATQLGIGQPTVSHHVRKLADVGFLDLRKEGTSTVVEVNPGCCTGLPHAADAVMGMLTPTACCESGLVDLRPDVRTRAMGEGDWEAVLRIYGEGIATGNATFDTVVPEPEVLDARWLPGHRWIAEVGGQVAGWATLSPISQRECYRGVAENSIYVGAAHRGRGVGKVLLDQQITAAEAAGLWTLQTSIFPENRASVALHHAAGFRTVGLRERLAQLNGQWRDTVLLERRAGASTGCGC